MDAILLYMHIIYLIAHINNIIIAVYRYAIQGELTVE